MLAIDDVEKLACGGARATYGVYWMLVFAPALPFVVLNLSYRRILSQKITEVGTRLSEEMKTLYARAYGDPSYRESLEQFYNWRTYVAPVVLTTLTACVFTALALTSVGIPLGLPRQLCAEMSRTIPAVLTGACGAYLWGLYDILRRHSTSDMSSSALHFTWLGILVAAALGGLASAHPSADSGWPLFGAFVVGTLPVRQMFAWARATFEIKGWSGLFRDRWRESGSTFRVIEGMTDDRRRRLYDEGIDSVQALAFADPVRLLFRTNIEWNVILDLIDQAMLLNYLVEAPRHSRASSVGVRTGEARPVSDGPVCGIEGASCAITRLRRLGIRGVIEMASLWERLAEYTDDNDEDDDEEDDDGAEEGEREAPGAVDEKAASAQAEVDKRAALRVLGSVADALGITAGAAYNLAYVIANDPLVQFIWKHWDALYSSGVDRVYVSRRDARDLRRFLANSGEARKTRAAWLNVWAAQAWSRLLRLLVASTAAKFVVLVTMGTLIAVAPGDTPTVRVLGLAAAIGSIALEVRFLISCRRAIGELIPVPETLDVLTRVRNSRLVPVSALARYLALLAEAVVVTTAVCLYALQIRGIDTPAAYRDGVLPAVCVLAAFPLVLAVRWLWSSLCDPYSERIERLLRRFNRLQLIDEQERAGVITVQRSLIAKTRLALVVESEH